MVLEQPGCCIQLLHVIMVCSLLVFSLLMLVFFALGVQVTVHRNSQVAPMRLTQEIIVDARTSVDRVCEWQTKDP